MLRPMAGAGPIRAEGGENTSVLSSGARWRQGQHPILTAGATHLDKSTWAKMATGWVFMLYPHNCLLFGVVRMCRLLATSLLSVLCSVSWPLAPGSLAPWLPGPLLLLPLPASAPRVFGWVGGPTKRKQF